jgi:RsiW-degrading membrane proteinase PrsW (M82 family)
MVVIGIDVLWGAVPAIVMAVIAELVLIVPLLMFLPAAEEGGSPFQPEGPITTVTVITMAVIAPFVEEILKAIPLLLIFIFFRRHFDGLMDGLLYGALVGFGFAMTENFFYIVGAGAAQGVKAELVVFFLRTIVFGMMHALWSSLFGIGLGLARYSRSQTVALLAPAMGLLSGMLLHAVHNYGALSSAMVDPSFALIPMLLIFASYTVGCIAWLVLVFFAGRGESRWIREEMASEVAEGVVTAEHALGAGRYRTRLKTRWAAMRERGFGHAHQLGRLYCLIAALAFKKRQLTLNPSDRAAGADIARLRVEIHRLQTALNQKHQA